MGIARGIAGFTMSTAIVAGGFYAAQESNAWDKEYDRAKACAEADFRVGHAALCEQVVTTKDGIDSVDGTSEWWATLALCSFTVGAVGGIASINETLTGPSERRPKSG